MTSLQRVYSFYSRLGQQVNPDNAFVMTRMQFWRLLKDCQLHYQDYGLVDMDRWIGAPCNLLRNIYGLISRAPQLHQPMLTVTGLVSRSR